MRGTISLFSGSSNNSQQWLTPTPALCQGEGHCQQAGWKGSVIMGRLCCHDNRNVMITEWNYLLFLENNTDEDIKQKKLSRKTKDYFPHFS